MDQKVKAQFLLSHPAVLGRLLGYKDLKDEIHGVWITEMVNGAGDMTLQAHRGSYKTTCLIIAIALMMIRFRDRNIIFLRKTDTDVAEVIKGVSRILTHEVFRAMYASLTGHSFSLIQH